RALRDTQIPDATEEPVAPVDAGGVPVGALRPRAEEHDEEAQGVRAVALDVLVRGLHVAVRLRHLRAAEDDDTLILEGQRGLIEPKLTEIAQGLTDEAHVEQVK